MLHSLRQLAIREGLVADSAFEMKPVPWIVCVTEQGEFGGFLPTRYTPPAEGKKKPKPVAKSFLIPRQFNPATGGSRTSGDFAFFAVEKLDYALGQEPGAKAGTVPAGRATVRLALFIQRIRQAACETGSEALNRLHTFLRSVAQSGLPEDLPSDMGASDLIAFRVAPDREGLVHDELAVADWWRVAARGEEAAEATTHCLITGQPFSKAGLFPKLKKVPGGQSAGAGIVSFNAPAFESYGWSGNENAPVSDDAANLAATALNRLLDPQFRKQDGSPVDSRRFGLTAESVFCFWGNGDAEEVMDATPAMLGGPVDDDPPGKDPGRVRELCKAVWSGHAPDPANPADFFGVTLSGAQGRVIVRDWFRIAVGKMQQRIAAHYQALGGLLITPPPRGKPMPGWLGVQDLVRAVVLNGSLDNVPDPLFAELLRAVFTGGRYPEPLLLRALERGRAEIHDDSWTASLRRDTRAAICRAFLFRNYETSPPDSMDPHCKKLPYLFGRLLACYGEMQRLAHYPREVNATVVEKHFGQFSTAPLPLLNSLSDTFKNNTRTARRNGSKPWIAPSAQSVESVVQRIFAFMNPADLPCSFNVQQQAEFVLGFHHQQHWFTLNKEERIAWGKAREWPLNSAELILENLNEKQAPNPTEP